MKDIDSSSIRNVGLFLSIDAGKTTILDRISKNCTNRPLPNEEVHAENEKLDINDEIIYISPFHGFMWGDHLINFVSPSGNIPTINDVRSIIKGIDGALFIFSSDASIEINTELLWSSTKKFEKPFIFFINKLDKEKSDFYKLLETIRLRFNANIVPIQIPVDEGNNFRGIIDLIKMKAYLLKRSLGGKQLVVEKDVPEEYMEKAFFYRDVLLDNLFEFNDSIVDAVLNQKEVTQDIILEAIKLSVVRHEIIPVLCGSAFKNIGIDLLLDSILNFFPSPVDCPPIEGINPHNSSEILIREPRTEEPFSGLCFKSLKIEENFDFIRIFSGEISKDDTFLNPRLMRKEKVLGIYTVRNNKIIPLSTALSGDIVFIRGAESVVTGDTVCDTEKPVLFDFSEASIPVVEIDVVPDDSTTIEEIEERLSQLVKEDNALDYSIENDKVILYGTTETHLEIAITRLLRQFGLNLKTGEFKAVIHKTVSHESEGDGVYLQNVDGVKDFAKVKVRIEPNFHGEGVKFYCATTNPCSYLNEIKEEIYDYIKSKGKFFDITVEITGIESTSGRNEAELLRKAARIAIDKAFKNNEIILIEPIMSVEVITPDDFLGEILGDLSERRSKIKRIESRDNIRVINSLTPLYEMFGYQTFLKSHTQGKGNFSMEFLCFEKVPRELAIIKDIAK